MKEPIKIRNMKISLVKLFVSVVMINFIFFNLYGSSALTDDDMLIICEVADPSDVYKSRFVELYNPNSVSVDFQTQTWYLCRQSNGSTWNSVHLNGSISARGTYVIAYNEAQFISSYGFSPDLISGIINGNGNDGYFLYKDGNYSSGILVDSYGVVDQNGSGQDWEYTDSKATRKFDETINAVAWDKDMWIIRQNTASGFFSPGLYRDTLTWNGAVSSDWNDMLNFSGNPVNAVPDISHDVVISSSASNFPSLQDTAFCHDLLLENGSYIMYHEKLFVEGESTIQLFVSGGTGTKDDPEAIYHFISPAVDSADVIDVFPATAYIREWDEPLQQWNNLYSGDYMHAGKGYSCWLAAGDDLVSFNGKLVCGDVSPMVSYTASGPNPDYYGYNLLGNPFPCCIDWDEGNWLKTNIDASIAVWSEENGGYVYWNGSVGNLTGGVIPVCQGFFVRSGDPISSIVIPLDSRVEANESLYKGTVPDCLSLKVSSLGSYSDETFIAFNPYADAAYDKEFDAYKLSGLESAPHIYSRASDNSELAINTLAVTDTYQDVPVEFYCGNNGNFNLVAAGMDTFMEEIGIFLEDKLTGSYKDLRIDSVYNFSYSVFDEPSRFVVHFTGLTFESEEHFISDVIKVQHDYISINCLQPNTIISIYDLSGKLIVKRKLRLGANRISTDLGHGIYLVELLGGKYRSTRKISF